MTDQPRGAAERARREPGALRRLPTPFETAAALVGQLTRPEITVPVRSELVGRTAVRVSMGHQVVNADEPRALGGGGNGPTPAQYALAALASSEAITFGYWSDELGIAIDALRVEVQGDIDLRGFIGLADAGRPGFGEVRIKVMLSGPEPVERYEALRRVVEEHCPLLDLFANRVPVKTAIAVETVAANV